MRKRIEIEGGCYFVTINALHKRKIFKTNKVKLLYLESLDHCRNKLHFRLTGYVIMEDHLHLLIIPPKGRTISDVMHHVNGIFANHYNKQERKSGKVIQRKFWEHAIRNDRDFEEKLNYIHNNPVKAGLIKELEDYKFSSFSNYYSDDGGIIEIDNVP